MKIIYKKRFIISFILLLQIISYSTIAQSKKEQISNLNYQLDSLKQLVQIGQIKTRELEAQLISVNKNLNDLLRELMITKRSLAKEDSLKTVFENELKSATKKLLLSFMRMAWSKLPGFKSFKPVPSKFTRYACKRYGSSPASLPLAEKYKTRFASSMPKISSQ